MVVSVVGSRPHTAVSKAITSIEERLAPFRSMKIKVETGSSQCIDNKHNIIALDVLAGSDDVPSLALCRSTLGYLDG